MKFLFGKYKGQDIEGISLTKEGEAYCKWLVNQKFCPQAVYDYMVYKLGI